jgi:hypothetical protein
MLCKLPGVGMCLHWFGFLECLLVPRPAGLISSLIWHFEDTDIDSRNLSNRNKIR